MDRLLKESRDSAPKAFNETKVTKIVCKEDKVMVLKLKDERLGPVGRLTQWPSKRRTSQLVIPIPRGGARAEGGLMTILLSIFSCYWWQTISELKIYISIVASTYESTDSFTSTDQNPLHMKPRKPNRLVRQ